MLQEVTELLPQFIQAFGPAGISFGIMMWVMVRSSKKCDDRIAQLEKAQLEQYDKALDIQRQTVLDYTNLVKTNTQVLADLTNCLHAMKDTLDHIDRKN